MLIVTASDDDDSYENKKIDYSIVGGNEEQVFQISTDPLGTGELILIGELDRERTARWGSRPWRLRHCVLDTNSCNSKNKPVSSKQSNSKGVFVNPRIRSESGDSV